MISNFKSISANSSCLAKKVESGKEKPKGTERVKKKTKRTKRDKSESSRKGV